MSKLPVYNVSGKSVGEVEVTIAEDAANPQVLQDTLVAMRANARAGTACTKTKGEVAGSGKKPWKQKGTGRARAGYRQSPIWRGGGVVFGPKPRDYSMGLNRKSSKAALSVALSGKLAGGAVTLVDQLTISGTKTKSFIEALKSLKIAAPALVVVETVGRDLALASRNVPGIEVTDAMNVNPYQMVRYPRILMSQKAFGDLRKRVASAVETAS